MPRCGAPPFPDGERRKITQSMSIANSIRAQIPPIHPDGYPFIGGVLLASLILFLVWTPLGWVGTLLSGWWALFFPDPARGAPLRGWVVVGPAGGRGAVGGGGVPPA